MVLSEDDDVLQSEQEEHISVTPPAKVRVTFFESQKPHYVTTPDSSEFSFNLSMLSSTMASPEDVQKYISMNMGVENPFRPEGELSKEAETLVRQVQTGIPLMELEPAAEPLLQRSTIEDNLSSPTPSANGAPGQSSMPSSPTMLEVQHGIVVPPSSSASVEQVIIKKKPKCQCCVII